MKVNQSFTAVAISLGLLLGACASGREQATSDSPAASPSVASSPATASPAVSPETADHTAPNQGGQVVEVGAYHMELVTAPEASGTHLDLFLQKGDTHEAIAGAAVTGQVQLPDGSQKEVDFEYDVEGKHHTAMLPEAASGEYKIAVLTDINGEKVNGRFSFTK
jgi:hypothetical protein